MGTSQTNYCIESYVVETIAITEKMIFCILQLDDIEKQC